MDEFEEMAQWLEEEGNHPRYKMTTVYGDGVLATGVLMQDAAALLRRASRMQEALLEVRSVLDANMGDSDPSWLPPDDVLRDEEPMLYCCIVASRALPNEESSDD